jgi:hypothetical protein
MPPCFTPTMALLVISSHSFTPFHAFEAMPPFSSLEHLGQGRDKESLLALRANPDAAKRTFLEYLVLPFLTHLLWWSWSLEIPPFCAIASPLFFARVGLEEVFFEVEFSA